jgi:hypothetical protein
MAVMKVETDIIASQIRWAVILVTMYVEPFKPNVIFFIGNIKMGLMSLWLIIVSFSQLIDTDDITQWDQREKKLSSDNNKYVSWLV